MKRRGKKTNLHIKACIEYRNWFKEEVGWLECELCKVNSNGTMKHETHHIMSASRYPEHKELHNPRNLILLCLECHDKVENKDVVKLLEMELVKVDRGLYKLFN